MKQFIVLLAMIALGMAIFYLIAGEQDSSIMSNLGDVWAEEIEMRRSLP